MYMKVNAPSFTSVPPFPTMCVYSGGIQLSSINKYKDPGNKLGNSIL